MFSSREKGILKVENYRGIYFNNTIEIASLVN